jgi:hypothetical protein
MGEAGIPRGPIQLGYSLGGLLPHLGLHRRGRAYYQESSYWHLVLALPFLIAAAVLMFLPLGKYTKTVWVAFFLFMVACAVAPYFARNRFGETIIVDLERQNLRIRLREREKTIPRSDVVALQLCLQEQPSKCYQLNLVWRGAGGGLERHCLVLHSAKHYVLALARRYESLLALKLSDQTALNSEGTPEL